MKTDKLIGDFVIQMIATIIIEKDFGTKAKNSKAVKLWGKITDTLHEMDDDKYNKEVIQFIKWYNENKD